MEDSGLHVITELKNLDHDVIEMASRAEVMLSQSVEAFRQLNTELAEAVIESDDAIDSLDLDIEMRALQILAAQKPGGVDLRLIGTAIKMITDIERVADLATDIARCAIAIEQELGPSDIVDLGQIAYVAQNMFRTSIEAHVNQDIAKVQEVGRNERLVDKLCLDMRGQIHEFMKANGDEVVSACFALEAVNAVERIADHSHNIAERVAFMITGDFPDYLESPLE